MIPRIDYPEITSPEDFKAYSKALFVDRRKFITRSFIQEYDKQDAMNMKKANSKSLLDDETLRVINCLFDMLSEKGWRNIFFTSREELSKKLYGKELPRTTLRYKLDKMRVSGILRIYDHKQGIKNNLLKVCINPAYGYRWQNIYTEEEDNPSLVGTDVCMTENDKPSPISSSFYRIMNTAKYNWCESLIQDELTQDRLILEMCEAQGILPSYIDTPDGSRPVWIVRQKYPKGGVIEYLSNFNVLTRLSKIS